MVICFYVSASLRTRQMYPDSPKDSIRKRNKFFFFFLVSIFGIVGLKSVKNVIRVREAQVDIC